MLLASAWSWARSGWPSPGSALSGSPVFRTELIWIAIARAGVRASRRSPRCCGCSSGSGRLRSERRAVAAMVRQRHERRQAQNPQAAQAADPAAFVAAPEMQRRHRPSCDVVAGKPVAVLSAADSDALVGCGMCQLVNEYLPFIVVGLIDRFGLRHRGARSRPDLQDLRRLQLRSRRDRRRVGRRLLRAARAGGDAVAFAAAVDLRPALRRRHGADPRAPVRRAGRRLDRVPDRRHRRPDPDRAGAVHPVLRPAAARRSRQFLPDGTAFTVSGVRGRRRTRWSPRCIGLVSVVALVRVLPAQPARASRCAPSSTGRTWSTWSGESPARVRRIAWVIGSSFASVSGLLLANTQQQLDTLLLSLLVVQAFGAAAVRRVPQPPARLRRRPDPRRRPGRGRQASSADEPQLRGLDLNMPFLFLFVGLLVIPRSKLVELGQRRHARDRAHPASNPDYVRNVSAAVALGGAILVPFVVGGTKLPIWTAAIAAAPAVPLARAAGAHLRPDLAVPDRVRGDRGDDVRAHAGRRRALAARAARRRSRRASRSVRSSRSRRSGSPGCTSRWPRSASGSCWRSSSTASPTCSAPARI